MNELELIREWYSCNGNVRRKYLEAMNGLSDVQLNKESGASFPSLIRIYCHVLDAYNCWFESVCRKHDGDSRREVWHPGITLQELEGETVRTEGIVDPPINGTTEREPRNVIRWTRTSEGRREERRILLRDRHRMAHGGRRAAAQRRA